MNPHTELLTSVVELSYLHDVRRKLITTPELRVKYLNNLRKAVQHKCPLNTKTGMYLVSDYDLLDATFEEQKHALLETVK